MSTQPLLKKETREKKPARIINNTLEKRLGRKLTGKVDRQVRDLSETINSQELEFFLANNNPSRVKKRGFYLIPAVDEEGIITYSEVQVNSSSKENISTRAFLYRVAREIAIEQQLEAGDLHAGSVIGLYNKIIRLSNNVVIDPSNRDLYDFLEREKVGTGAGATSTTSSDIVTETMSSDSGTESEETVKQMPRFIDETIQEGTESQEQSSQETPGPDEPGGPKRRTVARDLTEEFEEEAKEDQGLTGQQLDAKERQEGLLMTPVPAESSEEKESEGLVDESEVVEPQSSAVGAPPSDLVSEEISDSKIETPQTVPLTPTFTPPAPGPRVLAGTNVLESDVADLRDFADFDLDYTSDDPNFQDITSRSFRKFVEFEEGSGSSYSQAQPMDASLIASSTGRTARTGSTGRTIMGLGSSGTTITGFSGSGVESSVGPETGTIMGSGTTATGRFPSGSEPGSDEFSEEEQRETGANQPSTRRAPGTSKIYKPIHADALGLFFYDAYNPQWDLELFKDRLRRFGSIKNLPAGPFYKQSKMIVDKFGPDILVESLKFGPTSPLKDVFKENHEVLQLYFSLKNPHTGTRSSKPTGGPGQAASQTVGVPLGELAAFRGLIAGQRPTQAGFNVQGQPAPATTSPAASTPDAEGDLRVKIPEPEWVTKLRGSGVRQEQRQIYKSNPVYYNSQFIDSMRRARTNVDDTESPYSLSRATELDQTVQAPTDRAGSLRMASPDEFCSELYGINY